MSGPKSYIPPVRYSIKVFDGKLNEIFRLQSDIIQTFKELNKFSVDDKERNIQFNCEDTVKENFAEYKNLIKAFKVDYRGKFGQEKYDEFKKKINGKAGQLDRFLKKMKTEKKEFTEKRDDYTSFVSYEEYRDNSLNALKTFKSSVLSYIDENIDDKEKKEHEKSNRKIEKFEPKIKKLEFSYGFRKKEKENKQKINRYVIENENMIGDLKNNILKSVILKTLTKDKPKRKIKEQSRKTVKEDQTAEIKTLTSKINKKIGSLENRKLQKDLITELENLQNSEVFKDVYFYKEFYDEIKKKEKDKEFRKKLKDIIYEINYTETASGYSKERNEIIRSAIKISNSEMIKQINYSDLENKYSKFKEKNAKEIQDEYIRKEENEFLKSQLISGLQNMNYQVTEDTTVIDFEKQSEFLLRIPEQNNYINLRVGKDNKISYNFLIEENKKDLSIEEQRKKVIEMEETCDEFKQVLEDLEKMGLDLSQVKDTEASSETIMQLPKKYRDKLKKEEEQLHRAQQKEKKKKYLK